MREQQGMGQLVDVLLIEIVCLFFKRGVRVVSNTKIYSIYLFFLNVKL